VVVLCLVGSKSPECCSLQCVGGGPKEGGATEKRRVNT